MLELNLVEAIGSLTVKVAAVSENVGFLTMTLDKMVTLLHQFLASWMSESSQFDFM